MFVSTSPIHQATQPTRAELSPPKHSINILKWFHHIPVQKHMSTCRVSSSKSTLASRRKRRKKGKQNFSIFLYILHPVLSKWLQVQMLEVSNAWGVTEFSKSCHHWTQFCPPSLLPLPLPLLRSTHALIRSFKEQIQFTTIHSPNQRGMVSSQFGKLKETQHQR